MLLDAIEGIEVVHLDRRRLHIERACFGNNATNLAIARGLRQADQIDDRAGAVRLVIAFQPHGDLDWRAAEDAGLDVNQRMLQRTPRRVVVMPDVARGITGKSGERFSF